MNERHSERIAVAATLIAYTLVAWAAAWFVYALVSLSQGHDLVKAVEQRSLQSEEMGGTDG